MQLAVRDHRRDLKILHMRNNLKWTFTKIAAEFNISKARARQLYERMECEAIDRTNKEMGIGA